jgi:hypothetical protein
MMFLIYSNEIFLNKNNQIKTTIFLERKIRNIGKLKKCAERVYCKQVYNSTGSKHCNISIQNLSNFISKLRIPAKMMN